MRQPRYAATAAALTAALALVAGACGGSDDPAEPAPTPATPSSGTPSAKAPSGGTADDPAVLEPTTDLLDWRPVDGPTGDVVTRAGEWTLTVTGNGRGSSLDGPHSSSGGASSAGSGDRISDGLIDGDWAVVVRQDRAEQRPSIAQVTDLSSGETFRLDGHSDVPTTTGGDWALGEGRLLHATVGPGGAYCVASVDLAARASTLGWCAPARHGFSDPRITPAGTTLLTFDDSRPACRTLMALDGDRTTPLPDVEKCAGWDALLTDDGAVWSVVPNEHRAESVHLYARSGEGYVDLGPGTASTLTWCAGAAYFVRDPQRDGDPAVLMRWTAGDGLAVVYESPGGEAFLSAPRCGGDALTLTAMAEAGDEQVTADLS
ncbi:hypothetical protein [Nocardioides sp.]|uniref:hypothetical protein n=1 Tax=Nocardioides sp. TaxID=35761 RepID=UPI002ED8FFFF